MGRVWGDCKWRGRQLDWLRHCKQAHAGRMFEGVSEQRLQWQCTDLSGGAADRWRGSDDGPTTAARHARPRTTAQTLAAYYVFRVFGEF